MADPYEVFHELEQELQLPSQGSHQERACRMWTQLKVVFQRHATRAGLHAELTRSKRFVQRMMNSILHERYAQGSRARWLCSLKTLCRIRGGILAALLFGNRHHLNLALRVGPIQLHVAAALTLENEGSWDPAWGALLRGYLERTESLVWDTSPVVVTGQGHSYVRVSTAHRGSYSGWDEVDRYASGWAACVERDLRHDLDTWVATAVEFPSRRSRFD